MRGGIIARSLRVTGHASIPCDEHAAFEWDDNKKQSCFDRIGIYSETPLVGWLVAPAPEGGRLILHWREKDGPRVTPPSRKGFGSQVIERCLAHELEGSAHLDYQM